MSLKCINTLDILMLVDTKSTKPGIISYQVTLKLLVMPDTNTSSNSVGNWVGAASALAGAGINALVSGSQNRASRKWAEDMYYAQRRDALIDWNRQNEYNSPVQQMARLRQAKLNPNLIYGNGGASVNASPMRGSEFHDTPRQRPDLSGLEQAGISYLDSKMKIASLDNLRAQNTVINEQAAYIKAQRLSLDVKNENLTAGTNLTKIITELKQGTLSSDLEYRKQQVKKLVADTDYTIEQNARATRLTNQSLKESVARIMNLTYQRENVMPAQVAQINQNIKNSQVSNQLMVLERDLKSIGIYPGDPWYMRVAARAAQALIEDQKKHPLQIPKGLTPQQANANFLQSIKGF